MVLLAACAAAVAWMFLGNAADERLVGNANVIGGLMSAASFAAFVVALWPKSASSVAGGSSSVEDQMRAAVGYLARETLIYWQNQAKARRIMTPAPARVSWRWASGEGAAAAVDLADDRSGLTLLTDGSVSQLRRELYETLPAPGRIVILGGPGAGKTTAMLLLLIDVLSHHAQNAKSGESVAVSEPVPVWLTMGGWDPRHQGLLEWAAVVLNRNYPGLPAYAGSGTAVALLRSGQVALFLDGLDEMPDNLRGRALHEIDEATSGLRVVLTSRPGEYQSASELHRLWDAAVIDIQPVDLGRVW